MGSRWDDLKTAVQDALFLRKCVICENTIVSEKQSKDSLCAKCREDIMYIKEPKCMKCGRGMEDEEEEYCTDCKKRKHEYEKGIAVFKYEEGIKESIYRFKYKNQKRYGKFYAEEIYRYAGKWMEEINPQALIPVPIHHKRMKKRGYNQAQIIAKELSKKTGIELDEYILERVKNTQPQKELGDGARRKNLEKAFKVCGNVVKYKKIILVDDIYTTGSTIDECAKELKSAGIEQVYYIALCIGHGV